ncbi:MAG: 2-methylaconitate cis-trans isomerase PrpF family protein [Lentihominibacter sp.]|jgi:2-methylaconitate cis-trans-isomerase PrpF
MINQIPFKVVIQRGGTSKGIFIKEGELPSDEALRAKAIRGIFGTPDRREIDGLGGADVLTSKLAIIGPSSRDDCDVDYTFAQVSYDSEVIDYGGNCGNISAGVGPFVIDEGLVKAVEPITEVRIHQVNTNCVLIARVPVKDGKACVEGNYHIDGVPGTGAKIMLDFFDTLGTTTGNVLPTGNPIDKIDVEGYGLFEISIVDAGNVLIFIDAEALGLKGTETCSEIEADRKLCDKIEAIRSTATVLCGMAETREEATAHPYVPFFAIISKPADYVCEADQRKVKAEEIDIVSRLIFMLHMHKTYPGTGTVCTGAAARIPETIVNRILSDNAKADEVLRIGHPGGIISVEAITEDAGKSFKHLAYARTSRRIMEGTCYVQKSKLK